MKQYNTNYFKFNNRKKLHDFLSAVSSSAPPSNTAKSSHSQDNQHQSTLSLLVFYKNERVISESLADRLSRQKFIDVMSPGLFMFLMSPKPSHLQHWTITNFHKMTFVRNFLKMEAEGTLSADTRPHTLQDCEW